MKYALLSLTFDRVKDYLWTSQYAAITAPHEKCAALSCLCVAWRGVAWQSVWPRKQWPPPSNIRPGQHTRKGAWSSLRDECGPAAAGWTLMRMHCPFFRDREREVILPEPPDTIPGRVALARSACMYSGKQPTVSSGSVAATGNGKGSPYKLAQGGVLGPPVVADSLALTRGTIVSGVVSVSLEDSWTGRSFLEALGRLQLPALPGVSDHRTLISVSVAPCGNRGMAW